MDALSTKQLTFGFPSRPDFLKPLTVEMRAGQCWGIIGPNGAGKSTLLRLLAGLRTPTSGEVMLDGFSLANVSAHERARRMAFLPQHVTPDLPATAGEIVLMGRYPHRRFGLFENATDRDIAVRAMETTQTIAFWDRPLCTLSGGEAQRVHVAAALAQQPTVLLLDEPTAALDLHHQLSVFELLRGLASDDKILVVVVTHDVNLAARYCSHVLLLDDGWCAAVGAPGDVIVPEVLESVYDVELVTVGSQHDAGRWVLPLRSKSKMAVGSGDKAKRQATGDDA